MHSCKNLQTQIHIFRHIHEYQGCWLVDSLCNKHLNWELEVQTQSSAGHGSAQRGNATTPLGGPTVFAKLVTMQNSRFSGWEMPWNLMLLLLLQSSREKSFRASERSECSDPCMLGLLMCEISMPGADFRKVWILEFRITFEVLKKWVWHLLPSNESELTPIQWLRLAMFGAWGQESRWVQVWTEDSPCKGLTEIHWGPVHLACRKLVYELGGTLGTPAVSIWRADRSDRLVDGSQDVGFRPLELCQRGVISW